MPFYVSPEQLMKDRADFARKGIARGRSVVAPVRRRLLFVAENPSQALHKSARSTTGSRSRRSAATTSSRTCASPASGSPTCAATPTTGATSPAAAWPTPTRRRWARSSPRWREALRGRALRRPRSATPPAEDQIYRLTYDGSVATSTGTRRWAARRRSATYLEEDYTEKPRCPMPSSSRSPRWASVPRRTAPPTWTGSSPPQRSRSRCSTAPASSRGSSAVWCRARLEALLGERDGPETGRSAATRPSPPRRRRPRRPRPRSTPRTSPPTPGDVRTTGSLTPPATSVARQVGRSAA